MLFRSLPDFTSVEYEITATCGSKVINQNQPVVGHNIFRLAIEPGEWEIVVTGKKTSTQTAQTDDKEILFGQQTVIVDEYGNYDVTIPVFFIEAEKGSVQLEIEVKDSSIDKLVITGTNTSLDNEYVRDSEGIIKINCTKIPASTYSAVLNFYQNIGDLSSPEYALVISLQEKINVRKNMLTDSWKKSGNTIYLIDEQNQNDNNKTKFILSNEIISELVNSSFYVSTSDSSLRKLTLSTVTPSDNNTGSWLDPYLSLNATINKIIAIADNSNNSVPYSVYIDGPVYGAFSGYEKADNSPISITLHPYINPTGETSARLICNTENNTQNNSSFVIGNNFSFNFSDLILDSLNLSVEATGKLILSGNTILENGIIFLNDNTKLYLEDITAANQTQNPLIAKIKCDTPEENKILIESNNEAKLSAGIINRFRLQNPGYYLYFDNNTKKGIIKGSRLSIRLPKIGKCNARIITFSENDLLVLTNNTTNNNRIIVSSSYFNDNDELIFSAEVETPDYDSNNNKIMIPCDEIVLKLYIGAIPVISSTGALSITKNMLLPGNYILETSYTYDGLLYDSKTILILR